MEGKTSERRPGRLRGAVEAFASRHTTTGTSTPALSENPCRHMNGQEAANTSSGQRRTRFTPTVPSDRRCSKQRNSRDNPVEPELPCTVQELMGCEQVRFATNTRAKLSQDGHDATHPALEPARNEHTTSRYNRPSHRHGGDDCENLVAAPLDSSVSHLVSDPLRRSRIEPKLLGTKLESDDISAECSTAPPIVLKSNCMESDKIEVKENVHELFSSTGVGKFLVLQLPNKLPLVTCSEAENVTHSLRGKHDACANRTGKHLDQIDRKLGELVIYDDGAAQLNIGQGVFDVVLGTMFVHSEKLACIDKANARCVFLGEMAGRLVCIPDRSTLLA